MVGSAIIRKEEERLVLSLIFTGAKVFESMESLLCK